MTIPVSDDLNQQITIFLSIKITFWSHSTFFERKQLVLKCKFLTGMCRNQQSE